MCEDPLNIVQSLVDEACTPNKLPGSCLLPILLKGGFDVDWAPENFCGALDSRISSSRVLFFCGGLISKRLLAISRHPGVTEGSMLVGSTMKRNSGWY